MKNIVYIVFLAAILSSCGKEYLELTPKGTDLESGYYKNEDELYQGLVAVYDVLQWGGTGGWNMSVGLLNAASDDCYAGGSNASDQPSFVAYDNFTLTSFLGPQGGLWNKYFAGIYRANLLIEKTEALETLDENFKKRTIAEAKFLRAYFYFDLVRFFGNVPLITKTLGADEIYSQRQATREAVYAQIEKDLKEAIATTELPETLPAGELGRVTKGAANALLGKVILYQNNAARMNEAAAAFETVIQSNQYALEPNFADIFATDHEFGPESVFEIQHSGNQRGGYASFTNGTEGNYNVQFFGIRDFVGPLYAPGWSFCPVTESLFDFMAGDPRRDHTIINGKTLKANGASYTSGYQNTDYFIRKYAPLASEKATDGEPALNWNANIREIRFADVLLMAAEALARGGGDEGKARTYLNRVRKRVNLPDINSSGQALLDAIYLERRLELATEGHRYFDLVRTGQAGSVLGGSGFVSGKHELLPLPQTEIDIANGNLNQNPGY